MFIYICFGSLENSPSRSLPSSLIRKSYLLSLFIVVLFTFSGFAKYQEKIVLLVSFFDRERERENKLLSLLFEKNPNV